MYNCAADILWLYFLCIFFCLSSVFFQFYIVIILLIVVTLSICWISVVRCKCIAEFGHCHKMLSVCRSVCRMWHEWLCVMTTDIWLQLGSRGFRKKQFSARASGEIVSGLKPVRAGMRGTHGERGGRAYNGCLGRSPQRSPGAEALVRES